MRQPTRKPRLIADANPVSPISEMYRTLRTNIQFAAVDQAIQIILMTSAGPGEGKSTTLSNLATVYAQEDKKVLMIDADLRRPTLHQIFAQTNRTGLTNLLSGQYSVEEAAKPTKIANLHLIPSGPIPPNPADLLASHKMAKLLDELREKYDVILIDSPPVLAVTDAQILAAKADGVLLVMNDGKVKRDTARKTTASLRHVHARILGVVLNNKKGSDSKSYYYNYTG